MSASSRGTSSVPSVVKQENDWEIVSYDTTEQDTASDPLDDPFNNVGSNSTCDGEISTSPVPVIKQENTEQENSLHESTEQENPLHENSEQENSRHENSEHIPHTISPYFMSEVTSDTAIEGEAGSPNEESEAIEVAPDWSWEASNEGYDNDVNNEEPNIGKELDNSNRENVFIDVDYNGILSSDSDYKEDDDDDYDSDVSFGKRKKPKKSPQKNKNKKCKLTASDYTRQGSNKIEIFNNPEHIYIPDGWQRRVFQRLTGKYPGKLDVFYIEPSGRRFKSKIDIIRYYADNRIKLDIDVQKMCFGYGRPGSLPVLPDNLKKSNDDIIGKVPSKPKYDDIIGKVPSKPKSAFAKAQTDYTKVYNKRKCEMELSTQNSAVSALCDRLFVKDVTVEYSQEDFVNLTNHQVYTEYISALLESENPEASASAISEVAEAKWKQFVAIKESKSLATESKISQEVLDFLNEDNHEEPEDDRDEDYKVDGEDSNDSDYHTSSQKNSLIEKPFGCNSCPKTYTTVKSLKRHFREKNHGNDIAEKPLSCLLCSLKCLTVESLRIHLITHGIGADGQERKRESDLSEKKKNISNHVNNNVKREPYKQERKCELCDYVAYRRDAFEVHMRRHTGERPFQCSRCVYTAVSKTAMILHERIHEEDKRYKCTVCDYSCIQAGSLKVHMRTHNNEKPYMCTECGHKCTTNGNLKLHMRKHSDKKEFTCSFCETKFSQKSSLNLHLKTFHGDDAVEEDFLCSYCGHASTSASNLKSHMKTHTGGEKKHKCSVCDKKFTQKGSLNVHMRKHTGEKPFQCSVCEYKCTTKGNLLKHSLKHKKKKRNMDDSEDSDYDNEFDDSVLFSYLSNLEKNDNDTSKNEDNEVSDIEEKIDASAVCEVQSAQENDNCTRSNIEENGNSDYEEKFDPSSLCSKEASQEKANITKESIIAASLLEHIHHVTENDENIT